MEGVSRIYRELHRYYPLGWCQDLFLCMHATLYGSHNSCAHDKLLIIPASMSDACNLSLYT